MRISNFRENSGSSNFSRRRFVYMSGCIASSGLAGCLGSSERRFEASTIALSESSRTNVFLGEVLRTSHTIEHEPEIDPIEGEITIVSEVSGYTRGNAVSQAFGDSEGTIARSNPSYTPTLLERWIRRTNSTQGIGSAVVVSGAALDIGSETDVRLGPIASPQTEESAPLHPDGMGFVIPGQVREHGIVPNATMALAFERAFDSNRVRIAPQARGQLVDIAHFTPTADASVPWPAQFAGTDPLWSSNGAERSLVLFDADQSPDDVFGVPAEELPGETLGPGEATGVSNTVFASPVADTEGLQPGTYDTEGLQPGTYDTEGLQPGTYDTEGLQPGTYDTEGLQPGTYDTSGLRPAPVRGPTYGTGVFVTPSAEVGGEILNPIADWNLAEFLTRPEAGPVLRESGATDAESIEWIEGPEEIAEPTDTSLLDQDTELRTFAGVLNGNVGAWGVVVHLARVENGDDIVIGSGTQRTPALEDVAFEPKSEGYHLENGRTFTDQVFTFYETVS